MLTVDRLIVPDKAYHDLMVARAYAINGFVDLEGLLARVYQALAGGDERASNWAFFKLSSRHRFQALLQLGGRQDANLMKPFGESLLRACEQLTTSRNFIVHARQIRGAMSKDATTGREKRYDNFLFAPGYMFELDTDTKYFVHDVMSFIVRTDFAKANVSLLLQRLRGPVTQDAEDILATKFVWLPRSDHPAHSLWMLCQGRGKL